MVMKNPCVLCSVSAKDKEPTTAWVPAAKARVGETVTVKRAKLKVVAVYPGAIADAADAVAVSVVPLGE